MVKDALLYPSKLMENISDKDYVIQEQMLT